MKEEPEYIIKITKEEIYMIPKSINNWTLDQIIHNFFVNFPIDQTHASRDYHQLRGAGNISSIEILTQKEFVKFCEERKKSKQNLQINYKINIEKFIKKEDKETEEKKKIINHLNKFSN